MNSPIFLFRDHPVQHQVGSAAGTPAHFVFVEAVQEIEDRILPGAGGRVRWRQVEAVSQFPVHQRALIGLVLDP